MFMHTLIVRICSTKAKIYVIFNTEKQMEAGMADMDSDFRKFLESYKTTRDLLDKYDSAKTEEEKNSILFSLQSEYGAKFLSWSRLPIELKEKYQTTGAPQWVLDIATEHNSFELKILAEHQEINSRGEFERVLREEERKAQEAYEKARAEFRTAATAVAVVATPIVLAGYTQKAANELANERLFRDDLFAKIGDRKPTFLELGMIINSQKKTWEIIHKEWREHLPERHLIHLLAKYNCGRINEEKLIPQLADAIQRIQTEGHLEHLDEYLNRPLVHAKLRHFKSERIDELLELVGQQIYGGHRHQQNESKQLQQKLDIQSRDLPEDVVTVLQKIKATQGNTHFNVKSNEMTRLRIAKVNTQ